MEGKLNTFLIFISAVGAVVTAIATVTLARIELMKRAPSIHIKRRWTVEGESVVNLELSFVNRLDYPVQVGTAFGDGCELRYKDGPGTDKAIVGRTVPPNSNIDFTVHALDCEDCQPRFFSAALHKHKTVPGLFDITIKRLQSGEESAPLWTRLRSRLNCTWQR
jgi:hypothetical protein